MRTTWTYCKLRLTNLCAQYGFDNNFKQQSGARRLRDAIVFGYQLQRHPGQEVDIPEWYEPTETRLGLLQANIPGDSKAVVPLHVHLQHEL